MYVSLFVAFLTGHHWTWVVTPVPRSLLHRSPVGGWVVPRLSSASYRWAWSLLSRLHRSYIPMIQSRAFHCHFEHTRVSWLQFQTRGRDMSPYGFTMGTYLWVSNASDNGLLPDGTNQLPEWMLARHQSGSLAFTREQFCTEYLTYHSS